MVTMTDCSECGYQISGEKCFVCEAESEAMLLTRAADSLAQIVSECRAVRKNPNWMVALELGEHALLSQARNQHWVAGIVKKMFAKKGDK